MNFFKQLFRKKPKQTLSVNIDVLGRNKEFIIDVSDEARKKYAESCSELEKTAWIGKNEIETIRDDGYVIYKSNRVTPAEYEQIGFYGLKWYSDNNKFCIVHLPHTDNEFNLGLVETESRTILYKNKLVRPHRCRVTNTGIVVCEDWEGYHSAACSIYVIGIEGEILQRKRHNIGIGDTFKFMDNETKFKYNINSTGKIYIIDLKSTINN